MCLNFFSCLYFPKNPNTTPNWSLLSLVHSFVALGDSYCIPIDTPSLLAVFWYCSNMVDLGRSKVRDDYKVIDSQMVSSCVFWRGSNQLASPNSTCEVAGSSVFQSPTTSCAVLSCPAPTCLKARLPTPSTRASQIPVVVWYLFVCNSLNITDRLVTALVYAFWLLKP